MWRPVLWMAGALLSFMAMTVAAKELTAVLSPWLVLFFRSLVGLAITLLLLLHFGTRFALTRQPGRHLLRNTVHLGGQFGWVYGIALLPMAQVVAIEFTVPIWTALLAWAMLGERMSLPRLLALVLGFSGILLVLRPGVASIHPAALAVLGAAMAYALTHILTKRLTAQDSTLTILFWMNLLQLLLGTAPALLHWQHPPAYLWPWLLVIGASALLGHYCLTRALALADASVVVPLDFMRLPLIGLLGYVVYHERVDGWVLLGALLMVAGNYINVLAEHRRLGRARVGGSA